MDNAEKRRRYDAATTPEYRMGESMTLQMPDGLLTKLHDVATRRGIPMGDMIVDLCRGLVEAGGVEGHFARPNGGR